MSEKMRESLSALMDDEASELELQRLLTRIGDDAGLRDSWCRFNTVRSVLAGQQLAGLDRDISGAVREAIGRESAPLTSTSRHQRWLRPLASLAVAASVTGVVVLGGQQLAQLENNDARALASSVSPVGLVNSLGATTVQASYGTRSMPGLEPATRTAYRELARQRMQRYLQEHVEQASLNSPQGLLPFVRVPQIQE